MESDLTRVLGLLVSLLNRHGAAFFLTGGLVSSLYGEPRFTQDIDVVILLEPTPSASEALLHVLREEFIIDEVSAQLAIRTQRMFQVLHEETLFKVDLYLEESVPGIFSRAQPRELFPGIVAPVPCRIDAILSKLLWVLKGSHKSRRDIWFMLQRLSTSESDDLMVQAEQLGLKEILTQIANETPES